MSTPDRSPRRLRGLPRQLAAGRLVPVATTRRARLLGLAGLRRRRAGPGLLIPRCASVHTFGMRFPLDVAFLGPRGEVLAWRLGVPPGRIVWRRGASAVLELPSRCG